VSPSPTPLDQGSNGPPEPDVGGLGRVVIRARGISKSFDETLALDEVDLELRAGEVHALLGENGAGKTTLSYVIAGIYRADRGSVEVDGIEHHFRSPSQAISAGIGMVHQQFRLIQPMTVAENVHLGWHDTPSVVSRKVLVDRTKRLMDELGIHIDPTAQIWQLSVGEQQRVEILRTLARGARVLILDEPTAVLTAEQARDLFRVMRSLVAGGRTVVFISHKLKEVLEVSDRITVLRAGRHMVTRSTAGATPHELAVLMTGEHSELRVKRGAALGERPLLEIDGVSALSSRGLPALRDVTLGVYGGEIVGVAGVSGNGQTELAEVVTGLRRTESGTIRIDGTDVTDQSPRRFVEAHVGHIPEDRLGVALVRSALVRDNAVLRQYRRPEFSTWYALRHGSIAEFARRLVAAARVQTPGIGTPTGFLSGGNQQRLVAGREAGVASRAFIASQPTRGLDVQATGDVQRSIIDRRDAGCAVLLISDDLDEVLLMSDRVVVMYEGRIVGSFEGEEVDRRRIGLLMGGHLGEDDGRGTGER
jgi:ABC-type uncharacterized transport system ATPase subunit